MPLPWVEWESDSWPSVSLHRLCWVCSPSPVSPGSQRSGLSSNQAPYSLLHHWVLVKFMFCAIALIRHLKYQLLGSNWFLNMTFFRLLKTRSLSQSLWHVLYLWPLVIWRWKMDGVWGVHYLYWLEWSSFSSVENAYHFWYGHILKILLGVLLVSCIQSFVYHRLLVELLPVSLVCWMKTTGKNRVQYSRESVHQNCFSLHCYCLCKK